MRPVILIHPALQANERHKRIMPLGLLYLASYARRQFPNLQIFLIDAHVENLSITRTIERVLSISDTALVGIGCWTPQALFAYEISRLLRERAPKTLIFHGGVHPTIMPRESLNHADGCIMHEGELAFTELLQAVMGDASWEHVPGLAWKRENAVCINPPAPFIEDLDCIPFPAWDLAPMARYNTPLHVVGGPRLPIIMSRGCPYECSFCVSPSIWKRKVRWRTAGNVVDEMEAAIKSYGLSQYHFWDDNLLLEERRVAELCEEILRRSLKVKWVGLSRASHILKQRTLLHLMKRAGCVGIEVGIESANADALAVLHKEQTTSEVAAALQCQAEAGLTPLYTLMAFNPGETISGYHLQTRFINQALSSKGHKLFVGQFCTAYPSTRFYQEASQLGHILASGWQDYHHHNIKFLPHSLLDDKPRRLIRTLGCRHLFVLLLESYLWRYDAYPAPGGSWKNLRYAFQEARSIKRLFKLADGASTLRQIAEDIYLPKGWSHASALKFVSFTMMIGGQMGIVRSASNAEDIVVAPQEILFNRRVPNLVYKFFHALDTLVHRGLAQPS